MLLSHFVYGTSSIVAVEVQRQARMLPLIHPGLQQVHYKNPYIRPTKFLKINTFSCPILLSFLEDS